MAGKEDMSSAEYERFVISLQQAIVNASAITTHNHIDVQHDVHIPSRTGRKRQFDVYWEFELGGIKHKTVIECKNHWRPIEIGDIDALVGKMTDFKGMHAVIATSSGYQEGALEKATEHGIDVLVVRSHREEDWDSLDDDFERIRFMTIEINFLPGTQLLDFKPMIDGSWMKKNPGVEVPRNLLMGDSGIAIETPETGTVSLLDLTEQLSPPHGISSAYGRFEKEVTGSNMFLVINDTRLKMASYTLEYLIPAPIKRTLTWDISDYIIGVVEHLQNRTRKSVLRNGTVWDDKIKS